MSFGDRLKKARENANLTQQELAAALNITDGTISNYENGIAFPRWDKIKLLCKILQVDPNYMFWDDLSDDLKTKISGNTTYDDTYSMSISKYNSLDEHGKNVINTLINLESERVNNLNRPITNDSSDDSNDYKAEIKYFDTPVSAGSGEYNDRENYIMLDLMETPPPGAEFVVRVCGDSMEPTYKDGDKLYIKPQEEVAIGEIGIFYINGDVFVKERGADGLISHNQSYKIIPVGEYDSFKCYGKVIGVCKKYR